MLYLQILAFLASSVVGVMFIGAGLINSWHVRVTGNVWVNLIIGIPLVALGAWLPVAFGWIVL